MSVGPDDLESGVLRLAVRCNGNSSSRISVYETNPSGTSSNTDRERIHAVAELSPPPGTAGTNETKDYTNRWTNMVAY